MTAALLTSLVSSTLYEQRTRQASLSVEKLAVSAAPFFASAQSEPLHETLSAAASELGGRLLLTGLDGKVQMDTFGLLSGTRAALPEVWAVLTDGEPHAYGIHALEDGSGEYAAVCAARIVWEGETIGALLLSTPVTELRSAIVQVEQQLLTVFVAAAAAALIAALVFAVTLTRPIKALTTTIRRMGRGDLSARVRIRASGEMKQLADSYNTMAEKIEHFDKSRSQFVSNASHELKTPLATMKLLVQNMILQPDMPEEIRTDFMQDIDHEIDRLTGIVTDLLTLTQMDSSSAGLHMTEVDLSALTGETLRTLQPAAEKNSLTITSAITPGIRLQGDASKLSQIIYNLTDNALKYTPAGGEIRVSLAPEGREAVLTVRDNGIGIPPEDLPHIFDRFFRVDKARSRATGGTGLGLSIVRQMVQLHGGEISVEATPDKGSCFTVRLPLRREAAA